MTRRHLKTVKEKLETKLKKVLAVESVTKNNKNISFKGKKIFSFDEEKISYGTRRVAPKNIDPFYEDSYKVTINLNHETINLLNSNLLKPPYGAKVVVNLLKNYTENIQEIEIGSQLNEISNGKVSITKNLYQTIVEISKEENQDKNIRIRNRSIPFIKGDFNLKNIKESETNRNYKLLLSEIISSEQLTSNDVVSLTSQLKPGEDSKIVIKQEINKQTDWLLEIMRQIIDEPKLNKTLAQKYGKDHFKYTKNSITGPEHLMEKILSDYGKNIIFGVPALLNTNKYVVSPSLPRSQFDIILIDSLSDVELVELKRPDVNVLDYDSNRNKFYPSKDLSIAIGQAERYISALYKDNDSGFKIGGKTIKKYIEAEVGGSIELNITRPTALIVIGATHRIAKDYESITDKKPRTKKQYDDNMWQAYRELRSTHKNIKITTYSELVDGAELRLKSQ